MKSCFVISYEVESRPQPEVNLPLNLTDPSLLHPLCFVEFCIHLVPSIAIPISNIRSTQINPLEQAQLYEHHQLHPGSP